MQLPDFIKRALAFFDKAEANLSAIDLAKKHVADLEADVAKSAKDLIDAQASLKDLQAKFDKATTDLAARDKQITALQADLAKEKARANATIAGQGLPVDQVPPADANNAPISGESAWNKYQRLQSEGKAREAGEFWAVNADQILSSRK